MITSLKMHDVCKVGDLYKFKLFDIGIYTNYEIINFLNKIKYI